MFLSILTPTFLRPVALAECRASVLAQSVPVEHVVVPDDVGVGTYRMIRDHAHRPSGEYVMVLADDNILVDPDFAVALEAVCWAHDPDVVVFKGDIVGTVQPTKWGGEPEVTHIDLCCFAVRRSVWLEHSADWSDRREGDFDFIHAVWACGHSFFWWDRLVFRALRISWEKPE